jgi:hypothetical protein
MALANWNVRRSLPSHITFMHCMEGRPTFMFHHLRNRMCSVGHRCCLMSKKLLVSLAMEGKFCREGLQSLEEDDDMLAAMARDS